MTDKTQTTLHRGVRRVAETSKPDGTDNYVKVMAVADGYVMARRPRCSPFILSVSDFNRTYWEEWNG
jgi:hypothetical protein